MAARRARCTPLSNRQTHPRAMYDDTEFEEERQALESAMYEDHALNVHDYLLTFAALFYGKADNAHDQRMDEQWIGTLTDLGDVLEGLARKVPRYDPEPPY